jgi:hypothetical protein
MKTIIDAILAINPNAEVSMGDYRDINSIKKKSNKILIQP